MRKNFIIHTVLFSIFPILSMYSNNISEMLFTQTLYPLAAVLGVTVILLIVFRFVYGDFQKAGIAVSGFLIFFFSYGHVFSLIKGIKFNQYIFLIPWCLIIILLMIYLKRTSRDFSFITNLLNMLSIFLVAISLITIGIYHFKTMGKFLNNKDTNNTYVNKGKKYNSPDIYYLIFDRYGSKKTLKEIYNYDNSEFLKYLSKKGFYIADKSYANHPGTLKSLSSSLNMEYNKYIYDKVGKLALDRALIPKLHNHKVWNFLKSRGYKYIHSGSWYGPTSNNKNSHIEINHNSLPEFSLVLYRSTLLFPFGSKLGFNKKTMQYKRVLLKFKKIAEIPLIKKPTFLMAHFNIPHPPFIFDRNGNYKANSNYVDQLISLNKKIKILIDKIISTSSTQPIIIIQSDEGPRRGDLPDKFKDIDKFESLKIRLSILNAYYLPGIKKNILYPSISPVNSFRLIFNHYFNANFKLLPDESYDVKYNKIEIK
ncbi:sulfatase-like hydrolase/transferase [Spirochaetota bacterium]